MSSRSRPGSPRRSKRSPMISSTSTRSSTQARPTPSRRRKLSVSVKRRGVTVRAPTKIPGELVWPPDDLTLTTPRNQRPTPKMPGVNVAAHCTRPERGMRLVELVVGSWTLGFDSAGHRRADSGVLRRKRLRPRRASAASRAAASEGGAPRAVKNEPSTHQYPGPRSARRLLALRHAGGRDRRAVGREHRGLQAGTRAPRPARFVSRQRIRLRLCGRRADSHQQPRRGRQHRT